MPPRQARKRPSDGNPRWVPALLLVLLGIVALLVVWRPPWLPIFGRQAATPTPTHVFTCDTPKKSVKQMGWQFTPGATSDTDQVALPAVIAKVFDVGTYAQPEGIPNIIAARVRLDTTTYHPDSVDFEFYEQGARLYEGLVPHPELKGAYLLQFYVVLTTNCSKEDSLRVLDSMKTNPEARKSVLEMIPFAIP